MNYHNYERMQSQLQICSMIEYLDSINDGSMEAAEKLSEYSMEMRVGEENLKIQLDRNNFDAIYNMLLTLRDLNMLKMKSEQEE